MASQTVTQLKSVDIGLVGKCTDCGTHYFVTRRLVDMWEQVFHPSYLRVMPQLCLSCMGN